ncbi:MAG TPA: PIN domain-containing protein [Bradyrhizobium sp.]|nr:PIN domain-containing protein [Bradyrhizobium sp.]
MTSPIRALLDANVLCSNHLRNLLLQMAQNDLFEARWSAMIEQEWLRNMTPRTRRRIETAMLPLIQTWFGDALVTGFDADREIGRTDAGDRHVASAAVAIAPCVLVTNNLRHFDVEALETLGVTVQTADAFLSAMFDAQPDVVEAATQEAAANLTKSCPSWDDYLDTLANRCKVPRFVQRLRLSKPARTAD